MKKLLFILFIVGILFPASYVYACTPPQPPCQNGTCTSPGNDNPDDSFAVDSGNYPANPPFVSNSRTLVIKNGYYENFLSLMDYVKSSYVTADINTPVGDLSAASNLMVIPSGGLYGMVGSSFFKSELADYVQQGGTLIVFSQQHGSDFAALPVPPEADGTYNTITGYGWEEDSSCFADSVYIQTWHQILSGQSRETPSLDVDGYFTNYPSSATVIFRRTSDGQPAMIMYHYGLGTVIVTSMYSDYAWGHSQASPEEVALVRDMIAWAKAPAQLPEIHPGGSASVPITMSNASLTNAASEQFLIYSPDRSTLLSTQAANVSIVNGQSATATVAYQSASTDPLGIYHIDYVLLDSAGNIIQPAAETDSGRFAVSNPPANSYVSPDFNFVTTSDSKAYAYGSNATFTITVYNNTSSQRTVTAETYLPHDYWSTGDAQTYGGDWQHPWLNIANPITIAPNSSSSLVMTVPIRSTQGEDTIITHFKDESGNWVGQAYKYFRVVWPSVRINVSADKQDYLRGDTVNLALNLNNNSIVSYPVTVDLTVQDPNKNTVYNSTFNENFETPSAILNATFPLPLNSSFGSYTVAARVFDENSTWQIGSANTSFQIPQSQITVEPALPASLDPGSNNISFNLKNTGVISVNSGNLNVSLTDPAGISVYNGSQPFQLAVGASTTFNFPVSIPALKLGNYALSYSESDETVMGVPAATSIPNALSILNLVLDKPSYKIRDTANLGFSLSNSGKFNLNGIMLNIAVPDAGFSNTQSIDLPTGNSANFSFAIPLPATMTAGQHAVNLVLTFPSGSSITNSTEITIPQSSLQVMNIGNTNVNAGDTVSLNVQNNGGVDTNFETSVLLEDFSGISIYNGTFSGVVLAGGSATAVTFQIPPQAASGGLDLIINSTDLNTWKSTGLENTLSVTGLQASLAAQTDKPAYLNTENVTAIANVTNGAIGIWNGTLDVKTYRLSADIGQFKLFLPKTGWIAFSSPNSVAIGPDGSIYVSDVGNNTITKYDSAGNYKSRWGSLGQGNGQFDYPGGVAVGPDGAVYVADTNNCRIQKFDANGNYLGQWGSNGMGNGQFYAPVGVAVGLDGSVYVADTWHNRIQKFDANGNYLGQWGSYGQGTGQFNAPEGIAVGSDGAVYVADRNNNRIQKFNSNGDYLGQWGSYGWGNGQFAYPDGIAVGPDGSVYVADTHNYRIQKFDANGNYLRQWGGYGSGNGQFNQPIGIAAGPDGSIYVADSNNIRIQKFDLNGNYLRQWANYGSGNGQFNYPAGIAVGPDGSVYVADARNNRIQKFDANGNYLGQWGGYGYGKGQLNYPLGIAVGPDGSVYVADTGNYLIQKFDANGNYLGQWGGYGPYWNGQIEMPTGVTIGPDGTVYVVNRDSSLIKKFDTNGNYLGQWGGSGTGNGQFDYPWGVAVGPDGSVYVADTFNNRIQKFDANGNYLGQWGSYGLGNGQFAFPDGIAVGPDGSVYVADTDNQRIQKFGPNGNFVNEWGYYIGQGDGQFNYAQGLAVGPDGAVYVADTDNQRIQKMGTSYWGIFNTVSIISVTQAANTSQTYSANAGIVNTSGKFYLDATLKNTYGQTIAESAYPFYVVQGNTVLEFNADKSIYRPGDTAIISGQIQNLATVAASGLNLAITQSGQTLYTTTANIPAGGSYPFSFQTMAGTAGSYTLDGTVTQNGSTLAQIYDQYQTANPQVTALINAPSVVGNDPFEINLTLQNTGIVNATVNIQSSINNQTQTVSISAGQTQTVHYTGQITANTTYQFNLTGDLNQTLSQTVAYGLGASASIAAQPTYQEGAVSVPFTITNNGQLDENLSVNIGLQPGGQTQTRTYFIPAGGSVTDSFSNSLAAGNYTLSISGQNPAVAAQASFSVLKQNYVQVSIVQGSQTGSTITCMANLINNGYNTVSGNLMYTVTGAQGTVYYSGEQAFASLPSQGTQIISFPINISALSPGNYTLQAVLLDNANNQLASQSIPLQVNGPTFVLTQIPSYPTFYAGQQAQLTFTVQNTGDLEGAATLEVKAYDMTDSTQTAYLAPGASNTFTVNFMPPADLSTGDYYADYTLRDANGNTITSGQVKYHLAGLALNVSASLNKQSYNVGDTAQLTVNVQMQTPAGQTVTPQSLFARVNYGGYEDQQSFILNAISPTQTLTFNVPISSITGEKLFYGIYFDTGRSIYLNTIYIYNASAQIVITADKQVYNPGDTVNFTASAQNGLSGSLSLNAPGYSQTVALNGSYSGSFVLPSQMTAGTYGMNAQLVATLGGTYSSTYPFDVAGIHVKVINCSNDKGKYASSDTINTSYTINSNSNIPADIKAGIIDPNGVYTQIKDDSVNLSSTQNTLFMGQYPFTTNTPGIHNLVYGIYSNGMLLASGSQAFDVGDAVLLGLSTDKTDYPTSTEPVTATVNMTGSVGANLELDLDGSSVYSSGVSLNGAQSQQIPLKAVPPGNHTLTAKLTTCGLTSTKTVNFSYGTDLPALAVSGSQTMIPVDQNHMGAFQYFVTNNGKTVSTATTANLYFGGALIATNSVSAIDPGATQELDFSVNVLGKAGPQDVKVVLDPDNKVAQFDRSGNTYESTITVPDATIFSSTSQPVYVMGLSGDVESAITNLWPNVLSNYSLRTVVTSIDNGAAILDETSALNPLPAVALTNTTTDWTVPQNIDEGMYNINQYVLNPSGAVAAVSAPIQIQIVSGDFQTSFNPQSISIKQGQEAIYSGAVAPLGIFNSPVLFTSAGLPGNSDAIFNGDSVVPPGNFEFGVTSDGQTVPGNYTLAITGQGTDPQGGLRVHQYPLSLSVSAFNLASDQASASIEQLQSAAFNLTAGSVNGYQGQVYLSVSGLPFGTKAAFSQSAVQAPGTSVLTIYTSKYARPGTYVLTITGNDGLVQHTINITLNLALNPDIAFGILTSEGPGEDNPAWIRELNSSFTSKLDLTAFDSKYGATAVSADIDGDGYDEIIVAEGPVEDNAATIKAFKRDGTLIGQWWLSATQTGLAITDTNPDGGDDHGDRKDDQEGDGQKYSLTLAAGKFDSDWQDELVIGMGPRLAILKFNGTTFVKTGVDFMPFADYNQGEGEDDGGDHSSINVAAGDIDGDNIPEIIAAPGSGENNPALVRTFKVDTSMGVGNWNATGISQFIAFTKNDFEDRHEGEKDGEIEPAKYGATVAAGDIDGDGKEEIVVGTGPNEDYPSIVRVFKADGTLVQEIRPYDESYGYGVNVAAIDLDEDGVDEIVTGLGPGRKNPPLIKVFKNGQQTSQFLAYPDDTGYGVKVYLGRPGK